MTDRGRPPLAEGEARTATLRIRMKPTGKARIEARAQQLGITTSEAARQAFAAWIASTDSKVR